MQSPFLIWLFDVYASVSRRKSKHTKLPKREMQRRREWGMRRTMKRQFSTLRVCDDIIPTWRWAKPKNKFPAKMWFLIKIQFIKSTSFRRQRMSQIQLNIEICKWKWSGNTNACLSFTLNGFLHFSSYFSFSKEYIRHGPPFRMMYGTNLGRGINKLVAFEIFAGISKVDPYMLFFLKEAKRSRAYKLQMLLR